MMVGVVVASKFCLGIDGRKIDTADNDGKRSTRLSLFDVDFMSVTLCKVDGVCCG